MKNPPNKERWEYTVVCGANGFRDDSDIATSKRQVREWVQAQNDDHCWTCDGSAPHYAVKRRVGPWERTEEGTER